MTKKAFDRRNIEVGKTIIRCIIKTPTSRTTRKGVVCEVTDTTVTLIHNFKKTVFKIEDLLGLTIEGEI